MNKESVYELNTLRDCIRWAATEFNKAELYFGHGTSNAWDEAVWLGMWLVRQPWSRLEWVLDTRLTRDEKTLFSEHLFTRVTTRKPLAYILGEAWFAGERYHVSEATLVPRSPIAELIALEFQPWLQCAPEHILDMCTGSGCIGIACAHAFPEAHVDLVDISADALVIADKNCALHQVTHRVQTRHSDGFATLSDRRYDVIVSNPPYISEDEYQQLAPEYIAEPKLGLTSGASGFDFVQRFLQQAAEHLTESGLLVVEVGYDWQAFQSLYPQLPFVWPDFEQGGEGVFILTRQQLIDAEL